MKILLIDNYDSFTHNLAQYLKEQEGVDLHISKNDEFQTTDLKECDCIVISPGPGLPKESGELLNAIRYASGTKPLLGICLGLQAIYESFGGSLINLTRVQHGVTSIVNVTDHADPLLKGVPDPFKAGRYHSWVCNPDDLPKELIVTARDQLGHIMACRHKSHPTFGFQFHPESILTPEGKKMISNFVKLGRQELSNDYTSPYQPRM